MKSNMYDEMTIPIPIISIVTTLLIIAVFVVVVVKSHQYAMTMRINSVSRDVNREVVEIEYKGHQYLQYKYSIEHNPDCPCHTNKTGVTK